MKPTAMISRRSFFVACCVGTLVLLLVVLNNSPLDLTPARQYMVSLMSQLPNSSATVKLSEIFGYATTNASDRETTVSPSAYKVTTVTPKAHQETTVSPKAHQETTVNPNAPPQPSRPKIILWDPVLYWVKVPEGGEMFSKCEVSSCVFVTSRARAAAMGTPDAVMISGDHMPPKPWMQKAKGQLWVYISHESPVTLKEFGKNHWNNSEWRDKIDLAMVYRMDAQFPIPYGVAEKTDQQPAPRNYTQVLAKKTKLAAQVSSHHCQCQSRRGDYIRLLQKHASVDVFGRCGPLKCAGQTCFEVIKEQYKFYLAFENSLCSGYVTEKLMQTFHWDVIPVVRGNANYSRHVPKGSYIDTRDFRSPKALADYLNFLQRNDTAYVELLRAKHGYRMKAGAPVFQHAYCQLCQFLHRPTPTPDPSFHFPQWWGVEGSCVQPTDLVDE